jgi:hypothetical protein
MKRGGYNGRATFFDPGLGACGTYSSSSDYVSFRENPLFGSFNIFFSHFPLSSVTRRKVPNFHLDCSPVSIQMVAMNQAQYGDLGAVSPWCFQTITISYGEFLSSVLFPLYFVIDLAFN